MMFQVSFFLVIMRMFAVIFALAVLSGELRFSTYGNWN